MAVKKRKFLVSISSSRGGGRSFVQAGTPASAAKAATRIQFGTVDQKKLPKNISIIVTGTTKTRNAQTFFG